MALSITRQHPGVQGSTLDFTDLVPAGSLITRIEVGFNAVVTPASYPVGTYSWYIQGEVDIGPEKWLSTQVQGSNWPFTLPAPPVVVSQLRVRVVEQLVVWSGSFNVEMTQYFATVHYEPSVLDFPLGNPF